MLARLKASASAEGETEPYDALLPCLTGDAERGDYAGIAARLRMSEGTARVAATRLRSRFRELFREEIARTVESQAAPPQAEEEGTRIGPYKLLQKIGEGGWRRCGGRRRRSRFGGRWP